MEECFTVLVAANVPTWWRWGWGIGMLMLLKAAVVLLLSVDRSNNFVLFHELFFQTRSYFYSILNDNVQNI